MKKGQGAIMDALIFMMIASAAVGLMLYVSSLYGSSTNDQVVSLYNLEFAENALVALHYAQDSGGNWFWNELKTKVSTGNSANVIAYLKGSAANVVTDVMLSSPSQFIFLCFTNVLNGNEFCFPDKTNMVDLTGDGIADFYYIDLNGDGVITAADKADKNDFSNLRRTGYSSSVKITDMYSISYYLYY